LDRLQKKKERGSKTNKKVLIVTNPMAFGLFILAIGYFALTGKKAEMFGGEKRNSTIAKYHC